MTHRYIIPVALLVLGCSKPPPAAKDALPAAPSRLIIKNSCSYDIWVQQDKMPTGPEVVFVKAGASTPYNIPAPGLASTRFWPKKDCDSSGQNCKMGQSSPPCPSTGCTPPVDSKLEVTWGCTLSDKSQCGKTPQGVPMIDTFWNSSAVDGYTFPFTIKVNGGDGRQSCLPVDCSALSLSKCPTDDNLSNGGANPKYTHENLNLTGGVGCFSTCMKLNYPGFGGEGLNDPAGAVEQMYCCPTPPISSPACQAGPVPKTKYVQLIHTECKNTSYGYAYDDGLGGRNCSGDTILEMTIGPNCP